MVNQFAGQNKGSKSLVCGGWGVGFDEGPKVRIAQNLSNVIYIVFIIQLQTLVLPRL